MVYSNFIPGKKTKWLRIIGLIMKGLTQIGPWISIRIGPETGTKAPKKERGAIFLPDFINPFFFQNRALCDEIKQQQIRSPKHSDFVLQACSGKNECPLTAGNNSASAC